MPFSEASPRRRSGLLLLPRLATSDLPLPLCLYFTADRRSARAAPARVIYDQQLLVQLMTHAAGCQMWSPYKEKHIGSPTSVEGRTERGGVERRGPEREEEDEKVWVQDGEKAKEEVKLQRRQVALTQKQSATCGARQLIWMQGLSSALISAGVEKAKCLYYFISQLAARRLLPLCAYWPAVGGYGFIVARRSIKDQ